MRVFERVRALVGLCGPVFTCGLMVGSALAQDVAAAKASSVVRLVQLWVDKNQIPGALVYIGNRDKITDVMSGRLCR